MSLPSLKPFSTFLLEKKKIPILYGDLQYKTMHALDFSHPSSILICSYFLYLVQILSLPAVRNIYYVAIQYTRLQKNWNKSLLKNTYFENLWLTTWCRDPQNCYHNPQTWPTVCKAWPATLPLLYSLNKVCFHLGTFPFLSVWKALGQVVCMARSFSISV